MNVVVGDRVFVTNVGVGTVRRVALDGGYTVSFQGGREMHFTPDGTIGVSMVRRVFWHDPVIVEPPRDSDLWEAYTRIAKLLFDELTDLAAKGKV